MRVLGIDIGSRETKFALSDNGVITKLHSISTMNFYKNQCKKEDGLCFDPELLGFDNIDVMVSTGYGRNNSSLKGFTPINEIKAHVLGALKQHKIADFTLIDIGGQDVKIVSVENGVIMDMELNEKCAASSGRFLENMAALLEISVEELSNYHENPVMLNSTCSVFAESELIGKISEGVDSHSLYAGINFALYNKIKPSFSKFCTETAILSGGVAKNMAVVEYIKKEFKNIIISETPEYNGAIGCCFHGERSIKNGK